MQKTRVHEDGGKISIWNQRILFRYNNEDKLLVQCMNSNTLSDNLIGHVEIPLGNLSEKLSGFSKNIFNIDGHNHNQIYTALNKLNKSKYPKIIIAKTIKGNGSEILKHNSWHHKYPNNKDELNNLYNSIKH